MTDSRVAEVLALVKQAANGKAAPAAGGGGELLDEVKAFLARFVAFPSVHALVAVSLWAAHAHLIAAFENSPRLALLSPEPASGKTRTLEVLELLVPAAMSVLNASTAAIFRTIEKARPTLLLDEVDTIFTQKGKEDDHQDLRGLLNSGHRAGATIPRCSGPQHEVRLFPTFCAVALAGLGDLPDTVMSRSVVIRMRRRSSGETIEAFRRRLHRDEGHALRDELAAWSAALADTIGGAYPTLPHGIADRDADVWEPLVAIADAAGGQWPARAREAALALVKAAKGPESGSLGLRLLADLKVVFADSGHLSTVTVLERLCGLSESPWADLRGKPLDARGLARRLSAYGISSTKVRIGDNTRQGYTAEAMYDSWERYVTLLPAEAEHPEQVERSRSEQVSGVPDVRSVPEHDPAPEQPTLPLTCDVPDVPDVPDLQEPERRRDADLDRIDLNGAVPAMGDCFRCGSPTGMRDAAGHPRCLGCRYLDTEAGQ